MGLVAEAKAVPSLVIPTSKFVLAASAVTAPVPPSVSAKDVAAGKVSDVK